MESETQQQQNDSPSLDQSYIEKQDAVQESQDDSWDPVESLKQVQHSNPKLLFRVVLLGGIFCFGFFLLWLLLDPYVFPWFIFPMFVIINATGILFIVGSPRYKEKIYSIHGLLVLTTATLLILINTFTDSYVLGEYGFPWSMYPLTFLAIEFGIHSLWVLFKPYFNHLTIHVWIYVCAQVCMFFTFCFLRGSYTFRYVPPMNFGPTELFWTCMGQLLAWTLILFIHTLLFFRGKWILEKIRGLRNRQTSTEAQDETV